MKHLKALPLIASIIITTGCSTSGNVDNYSPQTQLFGLWHCSLSLEEEGVKVAMDYEVNYVRNGKSNGFGTLIFKAPDLPEMEYSMAASTNWEYQNGYLIETSTEIKLVNLSHPEFDEVLNLESLFPQNISESSEVLVLNNTLLTLKSESDGTVYSCDKVAHKS
ncbi:hypothetical protein CW748_10675 [Alteromonadales bacterium alter-6D02]|nr:hypothetical protein CW748_10675 [Alteromonadales bacterium alter-6D02]